MKKNMMSIALGCVAILCVVAPAAAEGDGVLTLQDSINLALEKSVLIHSAREGVAGAEAQRREAFTGFLPTFSTSYNYTRLKEDPTFTFPGIPPTIPATTFTMGTRDNYTWGLEARQTLFAGGGILSGYEASRFGLDAARMDQQGVVLDTVQGVKVAYYDVIKAERLLDVARQSLKQLKSHYDVAQSYFDVGMIPRNDLLHAGVQLSNGEKALLQAENGVELARSRLNTVLRRDINTPMKVEDIFAYKAYAKSLSECLDAAQATRPEIKAHALRVEQAKKYVAQAKSEYFPNVSLVGNYSRFGDTPGVSGSDYQDRENWTVMAVANWTFWEWGRTQNRVQASRSRANQEVDALSHAKDSIALEVKGAYLQLRESEKQIAVSVKTIEQAEENFRITEERYKGQIATSTDVLDAQTLLTKAKSDYTNALGDYHTGLARLERAMGLLEISAARPADAPAGP